jgi:hypothetical protein
MPLFDPAPYEKKDIKLFCRKWALEEAVGKCLDIRFQESKQFQKLIAELYAHAITLGSKELFSFLESRFNANVIQDKEIHLHFDIVNSREDAQP